MLMRPVLFPSTSETQQRSALLFWPFVKSQKCTSHKQCKLLSSLYISFGTGTHDKLAFLQDLWLCLLPERQFFWPVIQGCQVYLLSCKVCAPSRLLKTTKSVQVDGNNLYMWFASSLGCILKRDWLPSALQPVSSSDWRPFSLLLWKSAHTSLSTVKVKHSSEVTMSKTHFQSGGGR